MRRLKKYLIKFLALGYLSFSLLSLNNCGIKNEESGKSYDSLLLRKNSLRQYLTEKYSAGSFVNSIRELTPGYIKNAVGSNVILDSTIIGTREVGGRYYLKAQIATEDESSIYAEIKCEKSTVEKFNNSKYSTALIVTRIEKINISMLPAEIDTLNNRSLKWLLLKKALISGECLAYSEYKNPHTAG